MRYGAPMRRRQYIAAIVPMLLAAGTAVWTAPPAVASCVADPDALTLREMIDAETTGETDFPVLLLGIVAGWEDLGGRPGGGEAIARVAVAEHPVGFAPLVSDVRFFRNYPGSSSSFEFELREDRAFALVAHRQPDGTFEFDGACGESRRLNRERFRELVRYARHH
jgi:hypothetical protein